MPVLHVESFVQRYRTLITGRQLRFPSSLFH